MIFIIGAILLAAALLVPATVLAYSGGKPIEITLGDIGNGFKLRSDAAKAFNRMQDKARSQGLRLVVNSAFRTMEEQTSLYEELLSGIRSDLVARPGYSNHQNGIAVDIEVHRSQSSTEYKWLAENARDFGFVNTGAKFSSPEFWHWEFLS